MNWNQIEEHWGRWKFAAKEQWGELTGEDLEEIAGRRESLESKLQKRYGISVNQAALRVDYWLRTLDVPATQMRRKFARGA